MQRLAMVSPAIKSPLKLLKLYPLPHSKIGKIDSSPRINFLDPFLFLNLPKGSSEKNVSLKFCLNSWKSVCLGGDATLCLCGRMFSACLREGGLLFISSVALATTPSLKTWLILINHLQENHTLINHHAENTNKVAFVM